MSYTKLINQHIADNLNENVACLFKQGVVTDTLDLDAGCINLLTNTRVSQPSSEFFIRVGIFSGAVNNASIGVGARKRQTVSVRFNLYTPSGKSNKNEVDMEAVLDGLFVNLEIKNENDYLYNDTATPKTTAKVDSTGSSVWSDKAITYRFIYEYY